MSVKTGVTIWIAPPADALQDTTGAEYISAGFTITLPSENSAFIFTASAEFKSFTADEGNETLHVKSDSFVILYSFFPATAFATVTLEGVS